MTLTEVVVSTALVGILIVGSVQSTTFLTNESMLESERLRAAQLCETLLSELMAMPFVDPDGDSVGIGAESDESFTTRSGMDDVDDCHNWNASPPENRFGDPMLARQGWSRAVEVVHLNPTTLGVSTAATKLKRISVTVTTASGMRVESQGLVCDPGILDPSEIGFDKRLNWAALQFTDAAGDKHEVGSGIGNRIYSNLALPGGSE